MKTKHLGGNQWELSPLTASQVAKVKGIPGLRVVDSRAFGWLDAVEAAAMATGNTQVVVGPLTNDVSLNLKINKKLRDYQRDGVKFLYSVLSTYRGAILADDMGLGKTVQALTVAANLLKEDQRMVVVSPAAARETWREELEKWGFKGAVVLGPPSNSKYREEWNRAAEARIVVTSFHLLEKAMEIAFDYELPAGLIIDEAHRIKGRPNKRKGTNKIALELESVSSQVSWRLLLTATPADDRPRDLYEILRIAGLKFGTQWDFDRRYCQDKDANPNVSFYGGWSNKGVSNAEELRNRLRHFMLSRRKADVAKELPPITRQIRWVDPTPEAMKSFQKFQLGLSKYALADALEACLKGKVEEAINLAVEAKRFLLFTKMRSHAREISQLLASEYNTPNVCITGDLDTAVRQKNINLARAKGWGIVATLDSASESLNLQNVASVGIMHAIDYRPRVHLQGEGRIHRLGSVDPVIWYYVAMKQSADEVVVKKIVEKMDQLYSVTGNKNLKGIRESLGDVVDGPEAEKAEQEVLKSIYDSFK